MACGSCPGGATQLGPAKSNGGLYIVKYIGDEKTVELVGTGTGTVYSFGTGKKEFWVDFQDLPGLFADVDHGNDLRSKVQ